MKRHVAKKTATIGLALFFALSANTVRAADKVVVIPMGSSTIYTYGTHNLFAGEGAGNHTMTGANNIGIGYQAFPDNTSGASNTAIGYHTLWKNTKGGGNIAIGLVALLNNTEGNYNTAVGLNSLTDNTTGLANVATGTEALQHNTTGSSNTASGRFAGDINTAGSANTFIGAYSDAAANNLINATAIGYGAVVTASNHVRIGDANVNYIGGAVNFNAVSDKRKKKDITDIAHGLDFIKALRPVEYRMIKEGDNRLNFGFIAQDIEALLGTNYNILGIEGDKDRTLSLRYTDFIAPMVKAMQEQQGIIEQQKKSIAEMRSELDAMKAEIVAMKAGK
jgi:trimeric autotransporter adhesin